LNADLSEGLLYPRSDEVTVISGSQKHDQLFQLDIMTIRF
jgi:hypothetical protein